LLFLVGTRAPNTRPVRGMRARLPKGLV